jgi:hydroxypyruvate isomerase
MRLAANLTWLFTEHDLIERFAAAALAGFDAVEILFPYAYRPEEIAARLNATGLDLALINAPAGDWNAGERGLACLPGREEEFRASVATALDWARDLDIGRIHCMAGVPPPGLPAEEAERLFCANLMWAAGEAEARAVELLIEPLNPQDMPGYFLDDFGRTLALIARMEAEGTPPGLQFDLYHCAMIHGIDAVDGWMERAGIVTGHYQIAGVPGRNEPDRGALPWRRLLDRAEALTPRLFVGCEYRPAGRTEDGLGWARPWLAA